jgi:hypothetical protein
MNCDAIFVVRPGNDVVESDETISIGWGFRNDPLPGWTLRHFLISAPRGAPCRPRRQFNAKSF